MNLLTIAEEISIGFNKNDEKSNKLRSYVELIRGIFEEEGAILENQQVRFSNKIIDLEDGLVFLQGSYAYNTAIKHTNYDVDADIGFIADSYLDTNSREKLFNLLKVKLGSKYKIEYKKPCISIDFNNGYKIDIALYSVGFDKEIYFHNSINGNENKTKAKPKELINYFKEYFTLSDYRLIIRLIKHFIKTTQEALLVDKCNNIPSISIAIFMSQNFRENLKLDSEILIHEKLLDILNSFKNFVIKNNYNGPELREFCVENTFYKVKDINEVKNIVNTVILNLETNNYSSLVSKAVFETLDKKERINKTSPLMGTMGNG